MHQKYITIIFLIVLNFLYTNSLNFQSKGNLTLSNNSQVDGENNKTIKHKKHVDKNYTNLHNSTRSNNNSTTFTNTTSITVDYTKMDQKELLKKISEDLIKIYARINNTLIIKKEIHEQILEQINIAKELARNYELYNIKTQFQLAMVNKKIISMIQVQLAGEILSLGNQITVTKNDITKKTIEIEKYKTDLPSFTSICEELTSCSDCTGNPFCGWCASTKKCVEGNKIGPLKGGCILYNFQKCPEHLDCEGYSNCSDCLSDVGCGWCNNLKLGKPVCISKTDADKGLCAQNFFHHVWKQDGALSSCPVITVQNFVRYVKNNLSTKNTDQIMANEKINTNNDTKEILYDNSVELKIKLQIHLDRLYRAYNKTKEELLHLESEEKVLEESIKLNNTIKDESNIEINILFIFSIKFKIKRFE
jgi:hypothetical protein